MSLLHMHDENLLIGDEADDDDLEDDDLEEEETPTGELPSV